MIFKQRAQHALSTGLHTGILLLSFLIGTSAHAAAPAELLQDFNREQLLINTSKNNCVLFDIYIAASPEQRSRGLMFVRLLELHEGMLFIYPEPVAISMWMKNTLIPLDMLFIDSAGQIVRIHQDAVPLSEEIISSGAVVNAVLELNGNATEHFGIKAGNQIVFPAG